MFPSPFTYHRAASISEAVQLLSANPGAKLLAGGHSLLPLMKLRLANPATIVDIGGVAELKGLGAVKDAFRIGAATPHAVLAASAELREGCPVLAETASRIGDPAVRNRGTIGGSIAHADPGADLPGVLVALAATIEIAGKSGVRSVPAAEFFLGLMTTALGPEEVITDVVVPRLGKGEGAAYVKLPHPASRYAVIGAAAWVRQQKGKCAAARVVASGLVPSPVRLSRVERALEGSALDDAAVAAAAAHAAEDLGGDVIGDIFASAEYRRAVVGTYVAQAVGRAARRAG